MPADATALEGEAITMLANISKDTELGQIIFVLGILAVAGLRIADAIDRGTANVEKIADGLRKDKPPMEGS